MQSVAPAPHLAYRDELVELWHGDCRDVLPTLPRAELVLTDPPYVIEHLGWHRLRRENKYQDPRLAALCEFRLADYSALLLSAAPQLIACCSRDLIADYAALSRAAGRKFDLHVWHKTNPPPFTHRTFLSDLEYIALIWEGARDWQPGTVRERSKVFAATLRSAHHVTEKPVPLMGKYLRAFRPWLTVDPFAGSGTTLIAARALGLRAVGIERDADCCQAAVARLTAHRAQLTFHLERQP